MARFHNVYGSLGTYDAGREKAAAAICREVIEAKLTGKHEIEIWGSGEQTHSFMYIDDCVKGMQKIIESEAIGLPINECRKGFDQSAGRCGEEIAAIKLKRRYDLDAPKGVNGRNRDNRLGHTRLGAHDCAANGYGEDLYVWIYEQMKSRKSENAVVNQS